MERLTVGRFNLICFTDEGRKLMLTLGAKFAENHVPEAEPVDSLSEFTKEAFCQGNVLIFIGAVAIAVRAIAPFVKDKTTDPAVLVIDEKGTFVVPVLSGHIGGANDYAGEIASLIGAIPVVTTATDIRGEFAVDVFARKNGLEIDSMKMAKEFSAKLLKGKDAVFTVSPRVHDEKMMSADSEGADQKMGLFLIPKCLVVGMGCRKGKSFEDLKALLLKVLKENELDLRAIKALVSIDIKKDEPGLVELADSLGVSLITYSAKTLMEQEGEFESSSLVLEKTGADNVCERAVRAFGASKMLVRKTARDGMTVAIGICEM